MPKIPKAPPNVDTQAPNDPEFQFDAEMPDEQEEKGTEIPTAWDESPPATSSPADNLPPGDTQEEIDPTHKPLAEDHEDAADLDKWMP